MDVLLQIVRWSGSFGAATHSTRSIRSYIYVQKTKQFGWLRVAFSRLLQKNTEFFFTFTHAQFPVKIMLRRYLFFTTIFIFPTSWSGRKVFERVYLNSKNNAPFFAQNGMCAKINGGSAWVPWYRRLLPALPVTSIRDFRGKLLLCATVNSPRYQSLIKAYYGPLNLKTLTLFWDFTLFPCVKVFANRREEEVGRGSLNFSS